MSEQSVPPGFAPYHRQSSFSNHTGPYYMKAQKGDDLSLALRVEEQHLNRLKVCHGGLLMTLADNAIGDAVLHAFDEPVNSVTVSMSCEFMSPARLGDWLVAETRVNRKGQRLVFVECMVRAGERKVLRASAVMSLVRPRT
ncbi:MAG TPA: PaaI family thioesterase [Burkholderiaceae bacterium]|nr:PaaI family thioesterase [bacterium SGD-2]HZH55966.1 PaaI family thioesterase [Burkholderiaceae bacterium]